METKTKTKKHSATRNATTLTLYEIDIIISFVSDVFRPFGRPVYRFGYPNSGAQKTLFKSSFFSCISTKNMLK